MPFSRAQLNDIRTAVKYFQLHQISINNPRYKDYEVILQLLEEYKDHS